MRKTLALICFTSVVMAAMSAGAQIFQDLDADNATASTAAFGSGDPFNQFGFFIGNIRVTDAQRWDPNNGTLDQCNQFGAAFETAYMGEIPDANAQYSCGYNDGTWANGSPLPPVVPSDVTLAIEIEVSPPSLFNGPSNVTTSDDGFATQTTFNMPYNRTIFNNDIYRVELSADQFDRCGPESTTSVLYFFDARSANGVTFHGNNPTYLPGAFVNFQWNWISEVGDMEAICSAGARNHGDYVSCVAHGVKILVESGCLTRKEAAGVKRRAAMSDIGK